jgi:protein-S-isoprenylcysteine O-methyltransferase Ste14
MQRRLVPPKYLDLFLVLAIVLHFLWPIFPLIQAPVTYLGLGIILLGVVLNVWCARSLSEHKTPIDFNETPNSLVETGPYNGSRNPIYLSGIILSVGLAVLLGSLITFLFPITLFLILDRLYIPSEEKVLERIFGKQYLEYKKRVRRWV